MPFLEPDEEKVVEEPKGEMTWHEFTTGRPLPEWRPSVVKVKQNKPEILRGADGRIAALRANGSIFRVVRDERGLFTGFEKF
jgi:hypothetical protein